MAELSVLEKARRALVAVITAANVGTANIFNGKRSGEKIAPEVNCGAANAQEEPFGTGNFWIDLEVEIRFQAAVEADGVDPKALSDTLSGKVLEALKSDTLGAALSAATPNFTVFGFGDEYAEDLQEEGDCWVEIWKRRVYCCGASL